MRRAWPIALCATSILAGCSAPLDREAIVAVDRGRYGPVASVLATRIEQDRSSRDALLSRIRVLQLALDDGQPDAGERMGSELYELLRTQGLNADRTVRSVVFTEGVRIWKGEPFEQALSYQAIAMQKAMRGEWDNARAAAQSSLFLLRDFQQDQRGAKGDLTQQELVAKAAALEADKPGEGDRYLESAYAVRESDFALGHLTMGLSAIALARPDEARESFAKARAIDASLSGLCSTLERGEYNTVLIVAAGRGPEKIAYGPDNSLSTFRPRSNSSYALSVMTGEQRITVPVAQDVNAMAVSHRWNNLEDVRSFKSTLGNVMVTGGLIVASGVGSNHKDRDNAAAIGLAIAAIGALMKAGSQADVRFCEFFPQRYYIVPLQLNDAPTRIDLSSGDERMTLIGLTRDVRSPLTMRYVRLTPGGAQGWEVATNPTYIGPGLEHERVAMGELPFVFGGRCVLPPGPGVLERYQRGGRMTGFTLVDLENVYREEGLTWEVESQAGAPRRHVLDGGTSLVSPLSGTAGHKRLFFSEHKMYEPKSNALREAIARERGTVNRSSGQVSKDGRAE
jgi:hypothetical protein